MQWHNLIRFTHIPDLENICTFLHPTPGNICMLFSTSELTSVIIQKLHLFSSLQILQSSDLPASLVSVITGNQDRMTLALATHSVIKAIWYWGSAEVSAQSQVPQREKQLSDTCNCLLPRVVSTCSTPAPTPWKPSSCSAKGMSRGAEKERTGITLRFWKKCGEMLCNGRPFGFLLLESSRVEVIVKNLTLILRMYTWVGGESTMGVTIKRCLKKEEAESSQWSHF